MSEPDRPLAHARSALREGSSGEPVRKPAAGAEMRLSVAFAPHPDRLQALLGAYVLFALVIAPVAGAAAVRNAQG